LEKHQIIFAIDLEKQNLLSIIDLEKQKTYVALHENK
jgi:hypothetical protein